MNQYQKAVSWLESLATQPLQPARDVGLRRAERLLGELGDPHRAFRSIHVAGSSGKGSTATFMSSILAAAGHQTGLFRSPHLQRYTERIEVNGIEIDQETWTSALLAVRDVADAMISGRLASYSFGRPSFFEVLFAMSSLVFRDRGVEWAVVETGMGGRLDATNTLDSDVAVVTNVSLEHTQVLGSTIAQIAREKAAIIKSGGTAVTACSSEALGIVRARARAERVPLLMVPVDVRSTVREWSFDGQYISLDGPGKHLDVCLKMIGPTQPVNAACAFGAALQLRQRGVAVDDSAIAAGLAEAILPGRFEVVARRPMTLLDGAQSVAGAQALGQFLKSAPPKVRRRLVFAAMQDKDVEAMAAGLAAGVDAVVVTEVPGTSRGADLPRLQRAFAARGAPVSVEENPMVALTKARAESAPDDWLIVAGSLYLVGFVREEIAG